MSETTLTPSLWRVFEYAYTQACWLYSGKGAYTPEKEDVRSWRLRYIENVLMEFWGV